MRAKFLVGRPEWMRALGKPRRRWEHNVGILKVLLGRSTKGLDGWGMQHECEG